MRLVPIALVLLALVPARTALAHDHDFCGLSLGNDSHLRWSERYAPAETEFAVDSEDGDVTLLLTRDRVAMQLSDRTLHRVSRQLRREEREEEEDNALAVAIKSVVFQSVRSLLDHSASCPLRELRDVDYRDGELVFTTRDGDHLFEHFDVHDERATRAFSEHDARAFVREFRRLKALQR